MSLRHAVLGMLSDQPGSGYDLLRRFETAMSNVWAATQSQLYGELGKLEREALIEVTAEGARGRKEYAITEAGRAELRGWLSEGQPGRVRNEALLRVYFLGALDTAQALDYLRGQGEQAARRTERLGALDASIDWDDSDASLYGRLVLEWGKRFSVMQEQWAEWAVQYVKDARG